MDTIFFSSNFNIIDEWKNKHDISKKIICFDLETLNKELEKDKSFLVIADYDSISHDINTLLSSNNIPQNLIILESSPEIATGKMLISRGIKAYGNSRMSTENFNQMTKAVKNSKVWTYPELTTSLIRNTKTSILDNDSIKLIENRLSKKEQEVIYLVIEGLTNNAIASDLDITTRTVKAHISSIFTKLNVNDRISLILLLK